MSINRRPEDSDPGLDRRDVVRTINGNQTPGIPGQILTVPSLKRRSTLLAESIYYYVRRHGRRRLVG